MPEETIIESVEVVLSDGTSFRWGRKEWAGILTNLFLESLVDDLGQPDTTRL